MLAILGGVFAFRFLSFTGFPNDHFVYVGRGQQMLLGAWPVRDFVDPGFPLMYVASAMALTVFGHNLVGEALLVFGGFAAAAALTYPLARSAAGSAAVGLFAVILQALAYPRSYSYPKLLLHAIAITLCWTYVERPTRARRVGLAVLVAAASLFRPDHGVVLGLAALLTVVLADSRPARARVKTALVFAATTAALLLPWLAFVQGTTGLAASIRSTFEFVGNKAEVGRIGWPAIPIDASWGPGLLVALDHEAFLYYTFLLLPVAGALVLVRRSAAAAPMRDASVRLWIVVILAACVNATLLRDPLHNRLADVGVPQTILAAWLFPMGWRALRGVRLPVRLAVRGGIVAVVATLALSVLRLGNTQEQLGHMPLLRPQAVAERAAMVGWALWDIDASAGVPRAEPVTPGPFIAYLQVCTRQDDRVMYAGYAPETYFLAHRGFAAGQVVFEGSYYTSPEAQALMLTRLQQEQVPVVAVPDDYAAEFRETFTRVAAYIDATYVRAGNIKLPGDRHGDVFVDRRRASRAVYEPLGWPCFTRAH